MLRVAETPGVLSLAGGLPAAESLPLERIREAADRALTRAGRHGPLALQYGPTEGVDALRELVADGTPASPRLGTAERVLITTGSQQGLELVARVLLDPGDTVAVEDPVYLGARQVFAAHGASIVGIPIDADGLDTDHLTHRLASGWRPRFVYTVANFSNPSGVTLTADRRARLSALAQTYGFVIVEDDPYHALGFEGARPDPIAVHGPDHTVTLGSASKVVAPGLRVGWLHAPAWIFDALTRAKQTVDLHTPALTQLIVLDVLGDRTFLDAHLDAARSRYRMRAETLRDALCGIVTTPMPEGGMFLWGRATVDTRAAFERAIEAGVAYVPGDAFTVDRPGSHWLRMSFATLEPEDLRTAARRLDAAFDAATLLA